MRLLFTDPLVDEGQLRRNAADQVEFSPLIVACREGDETAIKALMIGFWPFVEGFEKAIDKYPYRGVIELLHKRFNKNPRFKGYIRSIRESLRTMRQEEGQHASLWKGDTALGLGITLSETIPLYNINQLLGGATAEVSPLAFFCHLAGTEYIAEELSRSLCGAEKFTSNFPNNRWRWGEVHLAVHKGEPSHLEIDEDLARACAAASGMNDDAICDKMNRLIRGSEELFFKASVEVFKNRSNLVAAVAA